MNGKKDTEQKSRRTGIKGSTKYLRVSLVAQSVKDLPANAGEGRDKGSIPEAGRSSGEGNGNPL